MKHAARIGFFFAVGVVAAGCSKSTNEDSEARSGDLGTAAAHREKAITASQEAAEAVQDYTYAKRDEFIDAAKRELSDVQAEMKRLDRVVDRSSGAARAEAEAKLELVSDKLAAAEARLDEAEAATETTWEDVQSRYRKAQRDLETAFNDARQWLSDRIEP